MFLRYSLRKRESSISMAPPPATTDWALMARLTIIMASLRERSASSMYWSAPPLRMMVQDLVPGQPVKMLYLSAPTWLSSNRPHFPKTSSVNPFTVDYTTPPVALANLRISSPGTLPAQKMPLSAKYWVARSPMGSLDNMIWAPHATSLSSFS